MAELDKGHRKIAEKDADGATRHQEAIAHRSSRVWVTRIVLHTWTADMSDEMLGVCLRWTFLCRVHAWCYGVRPKRKADGVDLLLWS